MLNVVITHATGDVFPASDWNTYLRDNLNAYGPGRITESAWSGGPPGTATDGDLWLATGVDANGVEWLFRYVAAEPTYKWRLCAGAYSRVYVAGAVTNATNSPTSTGTTATLGRAGDYEFECFAAADTSAVGASGYLFAALSLSGTSGALQEGNIGYAPVAFNGTGLGCTAWLINRTTGVSAGAVYTLSMAVGNNGVTSTGRTQHHRLLYRPIRII